MYRRGVSEWMIRKGSCSLIIYLVKGESFVFTYSKEKCLVYIEEREMFVYIGKENRFIDYREEKQLYCVYSKERVDLRKLLSE